MAQEVGDTAPEWINRKENLPMGINKSYQLLRVDGKDHHAVCIIVAVGPLKRTSCLHSCLRFTITRCSCGRKGVHYARLKVAVLVFEDLVLLPESTRSSNKHFNSLVPKIQTLSHGKAFAGVVSGILMRWVLSQESCSGQVLRGRLRPMTT